MRTICFSRIFSIYILALFAFACGKPGKQNATPMLEYEIEWGTSGGFTGGGQGYTLYRDGRLESWSQIRATSPRETNLIGHVSSDTALKIRRSIEENSLLRFEHVAAGNMTTTVIFRNEGREQSVSWPAGPGAVPPQIASFMKQLDAVISEFKKSP